MKRIPKPFMVEVRRAGRRSTDAQPAWPELQDQARQSDVASPPADQPQEPVEGWFAATVPTGRILPALDDPAKIPATAKPEKRRNTRRAKPARALPAAEEAVVAHVEPKIEPPPVVAPAPPKLPRFARLPRSAFPLGEQWKARLPTVALSKADVLSPGWRRSRLRKVRA